MKFSEICQFTDKQWQATEAADRYRYMLFGGSRGPGKSYWLRYYLLRRLLMFAADGLMNVDVMLACEDYPSLTGRQITKIKKEFPLWLGEIKSTHDHVRPLGTSLIRVCHLDTYSQNVSHPTGVYSAGES